MTVSDIELRTERASAIGPHFLSAISGSLQDASRAFALSPHLFKRDRKDRSRVVKWKWHEKACIKILQSVRVFRHSLRVRTATEIRIPRFGTEGLLANLLHVIEVLDRVPTGTAVLIDWLLRGGETGFHYGRDGDDVWAQLFRLEGRGHVYHPKVADFPLDGAFWGNGKTRLLGNALAKQRRKYHDTFAARIVLSNERVRATVEGIYAAQFQGFFCIGIHRRVGNWMVASCQQRGIAYAADRFVERVLSAVRAAETDRWMIYLATDDADAIPIFEKAFPKRLIVREGIKRTTWEQTEVHYQPDLSITEAEDVLIDTMLLARCSVLVHASSSVSTVASILNPDLSLLHV